MKQRELYPFFQDLETIPEAVDHMPEEMEQRTVVLLRLTLTYLLLGENRQQWLPKLTRLKESIDINIRSRRICRCMVVGRSC